jgi:DNA polymerase-3 subunit beta
MEFSVKQDDLQLELGLVQGIVEKKHAMAILSNIHLTAGDDGLTLISTDMEVSLVTTCPLTSVKQPGALTVSSRKLFEIVRALPSGAELSCRRMDNNWLEIDSGSSHFEIVGLAVDDFPRQPECDMGGAFALPAWIFKSSLPKIIFAITHDDARYSVSGAQFMADGEFIRLVATDGHRLSMVEVPFKIDGLTQPVEVLVPRKSLTELRKMVAEVEDDAGVLMGQEGNHIFFRIEHRTLITRKVEGTFPKYERVMPRENNISTLFNREAITAVVKRVALMSSERSRAVRLGFSSSGLLVSSSNPDLGEGRDLLEADFPSDDELSIGFNAQYLLEFLGSVEDDEIRIDLKDGTTQGLFRPATDGDCVFRHVIMPMRL